MDTIIILSSLVWALIKLSSLLTILIIMIAFLKELTGRVFDGKSR